jgi:hypothetical protein
MRDTRKEEAGRRTHLAARYERGLTPEDFTIADFTCDACGAGAFGNKEPVHCVRCGGFHFTPRPTLKDGPFAIAGSLQRMISEAQRVAEEVGKEGASPRCQSMIKEAQRTLQEALAAFYAAGGATKKLAERRAEGVGK